MGSRNAKVEESAAMRRLEDPVVLPLPSRILEIPAKVLFKIKGRLSTPIPSTNIKARAASKSNERHA